MRFKNLSGSPKRTISANGGLWLLKMVSEPNNERCASKEATPRKKVNTRRCARALKGVGIGGPISIGEGNKCQRGRWATKGGGL